MTRFIWYLVTVFSLMACAKIVPPDGGDIDSTPPRDTLMVPLNESTRFNSKTIYIEFNEYVRLNDIYNQMIVSPPLKNTPEIRVKKKGVLIALKDTLLPNVTYTMNFGEGIVDITEGNPASSLLYVFSTGDELDSLVMRGRILDSYTGNPISGAKVMLYQDDVDSLPRTEKPYYFTRTDDLGNYTFRYLKYGEYKLFALSEENRNYLFDDPTEGIAFKNELVVPYNPSDSIFIDDLYMSVEQDTLQYMMGYSADSTGLLKTKWYNAISLFPPTVSRVNDRPFMTWKEGRDSLFIWDRAITQGTEEWYLTFESTVDTLELETLAFAERMLQEKGGKPGAIGVNDSLLLRFDRPIYQLDSSLVRFYRDSIELPGRIGPVSDPFAVLFDLNMKADSAYRIELLPGSIRSREGWTHDTLLWSFRTHPPDHFGTVKFQLNVPNELEAGILEVYKDNGVVVLTEMIAKDTLLIMEEMLPASYKARFISDTNRNGRWDPANYDAKIGPEKVYNLSEAITVRSNWELDLEWDISDAP